MHNAKIPVRKALKNDEVASGESGVGELTRHT